MKKPVFPSSTFVPRFLPLVLGTVFAMPAIGANALPEGLAIGTNNVALGPESVATGQGAQAQGYQAIATGGNISPDEFTRYYTEYQDVVSAIARKKKQKFQAMNSILSWEHKMPNDLSDKLNI